MEIEEAIKILKGAIKKPNTKDGYLGQALTMGIESLENQKIGHWIENAPEWQNIDPPYICSECGNFHLRKTNYCDQCGSKMEG